MSDTIGRIIRRLPSGTSSGSNTTQAKRALASVTGHLLASDLNHLGTEYARRVLWTHPGFVGFFANSTGSPASPGPAVSDIDWTGNGFDVAGRTANACCGVFWIAYEGATGVLPKLRLRCRGRAAVTAGATAGFYLGVAPGVGTFPSADSSHAQAFASSSTLADVALSISLQSADLGPMITVPSHGATSSGVPIIGDTVRLMACTVWFGAYNSTGKNATADDLTDVTGLVLELEPG